jgi:hypothetical protein
MEKDSGARLACEAEFRAAHLLFVLVLVLVLVLDWYAFLEPKPCPCF